MQSSYESNPGSNWVTDDGAQRTIGAVETDAELIADMAPHIEAAQALAFKVRECGAKNPFIPGAACNRPKGHIQSHVMVTDSGAWGWCNHA